MKKLLLLLMFVFIGCGQEDRSIGYQGDINPPDMVTKMPAIDMSTDTKPYVRLESLGFDKYYDHDLEITCTEFTVAFFHDGPSHKVCLPVNRIDYAYTFEDSKCTIPSKSTYEDLMLCVREGGGGPVCLIKNPESSNYAAGTNGWEWPAPVIIKYSRLQVVYRDDDILNRCKPVYRPIGLQKADLNILGVF